MRICIGSKKAHKGDRVRLHASLSNGTVRAFCEVFVEMSGGEPSPYVSYGKIGMLENGKPIMVNSTVIRLTPAKRTQMIELVAEDNCRFHLMQDIDAKGDVTAKGKVEIYGRRKQALDKAFGWLCRKLGWTVRSDDAGGNAQKS